MHFSIYEWSESTFFPVQNSKRWRVSVVWEKSGSFHRSHASLCHSAPENIPHFPNGHIQISSIVSVQMRMFGSECWFSKGGTSAIYVEPKLQKHRQISRGVQVGEHLDTWVVQRSISMHIHMHIHRDIHGQKGCVWGGGRGWIWTVSSWNVRSHSRLSSGQNRMQICINIPTPISIFIHFPIALLFQLLHLWFLGTLGIKCLRTDFLKVTSTN